MADPWIEGERYELFDGPRYRFELDRRGFVTAFSAGLVVLLVAPAVAAQESGRGRGGDAMPTDVGAWLHIAEDGAVTVFTGKTEIGQNIRTSLTQAVAEELGAPMRRITLVMADTARTPFDMGTFGSRTTPTMNIQLRRVAAAARHVLAGRAEARGVVFDPASAASLGALVKDAPVVAVVTDRTATKAPARWSVAGSAAAKVNGRDFVTGGHRYTSDLTRPGVLHGQVVRPPAYGAILVAADTSAADAMTDVIVVRDGNFLAVAAPSTARAAEAAAAIVPRWSDGNGASARTLFTAMKPEPAADGVSRYTIAYIAHAPLEPRAAVAEWRDGAVTVWTGTQRPFGVQQELVEAFGIRADQARVIVPDTGSAYGGKHTGDAAIEAARMARAAKRPVKLVWSREEEFAWAYFRPAGVIDVRAEVRQDGTLAAWEFDNYNSGGSGLQTPYVVAKKREQFHAAPSPLRQGSYRGLAATANHFARESHMDDLARAAGIDPLAFRLKNLADDRLANALKAAAARFGWSSRTRSQGHGFGLAAGFEKGGYTAACAEVAVNRSSGQVVVRRIVVSFECGAIVNPDGLDHQVSGAVVQGLGGALFEAIEFDGGRLTNGRFSQYRLPRFADAPPIDVVLLDRKDIAPAGAGETPIVGIAPAIANAILDATGSRLRALPLVPNGFSAPTSER